MAEETTLLLEQPDSNVTLVRLNRPQSANALNTQMGRDLYGFFTGLIFDPGALRCVILTGTGDKAFCAGGDLKERNGMTDATWRIQHAIFEQAFYAIMDCPIPVIAAVNGVAYGGGAEFALACDFIYASQSARFAFTETKLGIIPGGGGTQTLARAVGARRAKELILSAAPFDAMQAQSWGMVNRVCAPEALLPEVLELAGRICANGPVAVREAKRAIGIGNEVDLKSGLAIEIEAYNRCVVTTDRREGIAAFNEKRAARFTGE